MTTHELKEKRITDKINKLIDCHDVTQEDLAKLIWVTRITWRDRLTNGWRKYIELSKLCTAFETTIWELEYWWIDNIPTK